MKPQIIYIARVQLQEFRGSRLLFMFQNRPTMEEVHKALSKTALAQKTDMSQTLNLLTQGQCFTIERDTLFLNTGTIPPNLTQGEGNYQTNKKGKAAQSRLKAHGIIESEERRPGQ